MDKPSAILIGFFPKRTHQPPQWMKAPIVREICSVSNCISEGPDGWIDMWKHSDPWGLFDSEEIAWSVTEDDTAGFDMYAYKMFPVVFNKAGAASIPVSAERC